MASFTLLFMLLAQTSLCEIWYSQRTPDEMRAQLSEIVASRTQIPCPQANEAVVDPFTYLSEGELPDLFVFWIDAFPQRQEMLIRGLDPMSRLQWSSRRGVSGEPRTWMNRSVESLLSEHPFIGVVAKDQTLVWASQSAPRITLLRRTKAEAHPFLPMVLVMKGNPVRGGVSLNENLHTLDFLDFSASPYYWIQREAFP